MALDKSKLTSNFYANFEQFMIANNFSLEDATKKAAYQANIDHFDPVQNLSEEKHQSEADDLKLPTEEATKKLQDRQRQLVQQRAKEAAAAKEKALRREKERTTKAQCALRIQKAWKGYH